MILNIYLKHIKSTMEKNKLISREELKTNFRKGESLDQCDFSGFIDSFRHKEDLLTHKEAVTLANTLRLLDNGCIYYSGNNIGDKKFQIAVSSGDEEDQPITVRESLRDEKRYLFGNPPYSIKTKQFSAEGLGENEYYSLGFMVDNTLVENKLFGNNLPVIPDGFEIGPVEGKRLQFRIIKQTFGQKLNIINTGVKFVNKTSAPILYSISALYWIHASTNKDIVTAHYDLWDELNLWYKADLRGINERIVCKVYDTDKNILLMTAYLNAGENNTDVWSGGRIMEIRNLKIECDYYRTGK